MDSDVIWMRYSKEMTRNVKYIEYIQAIPILDILLTPSYVTNLRTYIDNMNNTPITIITPVCTVHLDLRYLGLPLSRTTRALQHYEKCMKWYNADLDIPNKLEYRYVLECTVESWVDTKHTSVILHCSLLGERFMMTSASVTFFCYPAPTAAPTATRTTAISTDAAPTGARLLTSGMKLVDAAFIEQYPSVLSEIGGVKKGHNYEVKGQNYDNTSVVSSSSVYI